MTITKHLGTIRNTGSTVVVVLQKIPDREDHALIVEVESLPPKYQDSFADLIKNEAQRTNEDVAALLNRRRFPSGEIMLPTLHREGYLKAYPQEHIVMRVNPQQSIDLTDLVKAVDQLKNPKKEEAVQEDITPAAKAQALLAEATKLKDSLTSVQENIKKLEEEAYSLDPSLKPKKVRKTATAKA